MKRKFRVGPFLPAAAAAAALCICLILSGLPARAGAKTPAAPAVSAPGTSVQAASSARTSRRLKVAYTNLSASAEPLPLEAKPHTVHSGGETAPQAAPEAVPEAVSATAAVPDDLVLLDTFIATAYCVTGTTSTGTYTTENRTLAVNPNIIPYGTHVWLFLDDGTLVGDYYAEDTGSNMMENPYVVDIYMGEGSYDECILWGAQHVSIYVEADAEAS